MTETLTEEIYKMGDKIPKAGRYQCVVCGFVVEYLEKHLAYGVAFPICPVCQSGTDAGTKKAHEEFWKYIGA